MINQLWIFSQHENERTTLIFLQYRYIRIAAADFFQESM